MSEMLSLKLDDSAIKRIQIALEAAAKRAPDAARRAINWTGDRAKTRVAPALTTQTGLKRGTINRFMHVTRASYGSLMYRIVGRGGDVGLKYFGARETRKGVSAAPWGKRRVYGGSFIKGGQFPNRVALGKLHGHVFARTGEGRLPIAKQKSGLFIPEEMVKGASAEAFEVAVATLLPARVEHEVAAILSGIVA